jgi:phosphoribosyl 1,2-cyclic phosphate phosphodiesterase
MLPATHSEGCFGILIESDAKRVAYFPDTAALAPEAAERLEGIDALLLDATFNGANWLPYSHNSIAQAIKTARTIQAKHTFLTHLSMHYDEPITTAELEAGLAAHGGAISAAYDGLKLDL